MITLRPTLMMPESTWYFRSACHLPGPVWARLPDLLEDPAGLPPFRQAVGHTPVKQVGWFDCPRGGEGRGEKRRSLNRNRPRASDEHPREPLQAALPNPVPSAGGRAATRPLPSPRVDSLR